MTARDDLYYALTVGAPLAQEAHQRVEAFRAEVLREAADHLDERALKRPLRDAEAVRTASVELRRMAAVAVGPVRTQETGCAGFEPGDLCVRCGDARRWHRAEGGGAA